MNPVEQYIENKIYELSRIQDKLKQEMKLNKDKLTSFRAGRANENGSMLRKLQDELLQLRSYKKII